MYIYYYPSLNVHDTLYTVECRWPHIYSYATIFSIIQDVGNINNHIYFSHNNSYYQRNNKKKE